MCFSCTHVHYIYLNPKWRPRNWPRSYSSTTLTAQGLQPNLCSQTRGHTIWSVQTTCFATGMVYTAQSVQTGRWSPRTSLRLWLAGWPDVVPLATRLMMRTPTRRMALSGVNLPGGRGWGPGLLSSPGRWRNFPSGSETSSEEENSDSKRPLSSPANPSRSASPHPNRSQSLRACSPSTTVFQCISMKFYSWLSEPWAFPRIPRRKMPLSPPSRRPGRCSREFPR